MAVSLRITDGTNTVILTGTDALFERYQPAGYVPDGVFQWSPQGGELTGLENNNVTESITLQLISTSNINTIRDTQRKLVRLLQQAARRQAYPDAVVPVYLEIQLDYDGADWWRSEILAGKLRPGELLFDTDWLDKDVAFTLEFTRRNYWEGPETILTISSAATAATAGHVTVDNTTDNAVDAGLTARGCYIDISANQVTGDLPTPPIISIKEPNLTIYTAWLFNNAYSAPSTLVHIYEAEDGTYPLNGITTSISVIGDNSYPPANYSNYNASPDGFRYANATLAITGSPLADTIIRWTPTAATLTAAGVRSFHVFVHGDGLGVAALKLRVRLTSGGNVSYPSETPLVTAVNTLQDWQNLYLGVITLPPVPVSSALSSNTVWTLDLYAETDNTTGIVVDYIALFPADSLTKISASASVYGGLIATETMTVDQLAGAIDIDNEGNNGFTQEGRLELLPGLAQRIYCQWIGSPVTGFGPAYMQSDVQLTIRPRRSII